MRHILALATFDLDAVSGLAMALRKLSYCFSSQLSSSLLGSVFMSFSCSYAEMVRKHSCMHILQPKFFDTRITKHHNSSI